MCVTDFELHHIDNHKISHDSNIANILALLSRNLRDFFCLACKPISMCEVCMKSFVTQDIS